MKYLHYEVSTNSDDVIEVTLDSQANVLLLDSWNYSRYREGESFEYRGGWAKQSPVRFSPGSGNWHVVVDLGGYAGSVGAGVRVIR